jgi:hypothetical protein
MIKLWFLENEGLPYLVGTYKSEDRAVYEREKFISRITDPEPLWWMWMEDDDTLA